MNRSLLSALLFALAFTALVPAERAEAQAWIRDPGSAFIQLNYRLIRAERLYAPDGSVVDIRPYRQHAVGLYAEAGVVDRWLMLAVDGELFRRGVLPDQGAVSGMGDIGIAAWTGILEAPFRLAFGVRSLPAGSTPLLARRANFAEERLGKLPRGARKGPVSARDSNSSNLRVLRSSMY